MQPVGLLVSLSILVPASTQPSAQSEPACWSVQGTFSTIPSFRYGWSVAISGDTLLVANDLGGTGAQVFVRSGGTWTFQQELFPSTPGQTGGADHFVAIDGSLAVSTDSRDDQAANNAGAAFVFRRQGTAWSEEAKLTASDATSNALFGRYVAIDGERIALGAPGQGTVYVFERQGGSWVETQRLDVSTGQARGNALALDGDTLAIRNMSASFPQPNDSVRVFVNLGAGWTLQQTLPTPDNDLVFGQSVALCGDRLVAGSPSTANDPDADAVFSFARSDGLWSAESTLAPAPGTGRFHDYGIALALDGTRLAVGALAVAEPPGLVFVYELSGSTWSERAQLQAPPEVPTPKGSARFFGHSLDLDGATIVTGEPIYPLGMTILRGRAWVFASDPSHAPEVGFRNAGSNPVSYAAGEARLGEALGLTVAPAMTGHSHALVFGFDSPGTLVLGSGQTLLCLDLGGGGEQLNTGFRPGPFASFQVPVPYDLTLIGTEICTQAVHAFGAPGFALSNAQDLRIGPPRGACP